MHAYFASISWHPRTLGLQQTLLAFQAFIDTKPEPALPEETVRAVRILVDYGDFGEDKWLTLDVERAIKNIRRWARAL